MISPCFTKFPALTISAHWLSDLPVFFNRFSIMVISAWSITLFILDKYKSQDILFLAVKVAPGISSHDFLSLIHENPPYPPLSHRPASHWPAGEKKSAGSANLRISDPSDGHRCSCAPISL